MSILRELKSVSDSSQKRFRRLKVALKSRHRPNKFKHNLLHLNSHHNSSNKDSLHVRQPQLNKKNPKYKSSYQKST